MRSIRPRAAAVVVGAVAAALLTQVPALVLPAAAAAAPPDFLGTLAGPSLGAMYPSGEQYDAANDRLVVADTGRDRVLVYSLTGTKLFEFGSYGTGDGQFASPRDVAVDDQGRIYVADAENNRIQAFTADGDFRWKAGGLSQGADTLNTPIGLTWDSANDVLLVASTGQSLVKAYSPSGDRLWNSPTGATLGMSSPRDVERGPDGRMWVTAYHEHQIKVYDVTPAGDWTTTPVWVLGDGAKNGKDDNQLNFPYNVAWSPDGDTAYVADTGNGRIARWDISGPTPQWLPPFGGHCGNHPQPCEDPPGDAGKFNHLRRVTVDSDGNIYGADFWGAGIEVFRPDGTSLREIEGFEPPVPGVSEAYAVDVAQDGQVYVMDRLNHRIERFTAGGAYVNKVGARGTQPATFSWPEGLTVAPNGRVWALDTRGGRIESFPADLATKPTVKSYGDTGDGADQMNYPSNADVAPDGVVWIADARNDRLMRFDPATETFLAPVGAGLKGPMGVAVTDDAVYVADTGNDRIVKLTPTGTQTASFATGLDEPQGLEVAPDGSVWVADTMNSRLVHLSANLVDLKDGFGSPGDGDHQFFDPHDLAFGNDKMYVADTYNNRVQVFAEPGTSEPPADPGGDEWTYDSKISAPGGRAPFYPAGLAIAGNGTWYVADSAGSRLVTVNPSTDAVTPVDTPALDDPRDVVLDSSVAGRLWVLNTGANRVLRLSTSGANQGSPITGLNQPYGLTQNDGRVFVANTYDGEVRAYAKSDLTTPAWTQTTCGGTAFSRPRDVAVADDGRVVVADTDNDRIVLLDAATGACDGGFGSRGTGVGQFKSPRTVASDGNGGLWVGDAFNYRIQHLSLAGASLGATPAGAYGSGADQFVSPHCVTPIPGTEQVAVCDTFNYRISVWDGSGATPTRDRTVGGTRPAKGGFNGPFGVAYGPSGELYVADWFNHRIEKFAADGTFLWQRGNYGPQDGSLVFPRNVLVAGGKVYVTDSENNRIDAFTPAGDFVERIGEGTGLSRPHQVALDGSGGFWVADTNNDRVVHLDSGGTVLSQFPVSGAATHSRPQGIAVDTNGTLLVSNSSNGRLERYSTGGTLQGTVLDAPAVTTPAGLQVTGTGAAKRILVSDVGGDRVVVLDGSGDTVQVVGSSGSGPGELSQPRGAALDPSDGDLAIADWGNDRISVWTRSAGASCADAAASYDAALGRGPDVLRYGLAGARFCTDGTRATVADKGAARARTLRPTAVRTAMSGLGMRFRYDGSDPVRAKQLANGSARARVSGSWSSCMDLAYGDRLIRSGIRAVRATASGPLRSRLSHWSAKRIATSGKIPARVKRQIAESGVVATLGSAPRPARASLRALAFDLVDRAFAKRAGDGLKRLVAGTCVARVWAPTVTITMTAGGHVSSRLTGAAQALRVGTP